jgi:glycogen synthase
MFTQDEFQRLADALLRHASAPRLIAYCSFENPFARSGGLFAVAAQYARALRHRGERVLVFSPYHKGLATAPEKGELKKAGDGTAQFDRTNVPIELYEYEADDVRWILIRAEGYFDADGGKTGTDPYVYAKPARLLRDSLFACAAVPNALAALGETANVVVHAQDWEMAPLALTVKEAVLEGRLESAAVVLTSHNPFDEGMPPEAFEAITERPYPTEAVQTVYQVMIPLTDAPVSTVSETFAEELTTDPLQTFHFAEHLQDAFRMHGLVGVNNGVFGALRPPFSDAAVAAVREGNPVRILEAKLALRRRMLTELGDYQDGRILGSLGDGLTELPDDVPVFFMFGRLDPGQKGFDVMARAIRRIERGAAKFVLAPIVSGGASAFADDLEALARVCESDVLVYPFRMERGYRETMAGATFAVMPSMYEPFGAATEPYLAGTPVVARATGGLVQQVRDAGQDPANATGILYREKVGAADRTLGQQWRSIQYAGSPSARESVPLYEALVASLTMALGERSQSTGTRPRIRWRIRRMAGCWRTCTTRRHSLRGTRRTRGTTRCTIGLWGSVVRTRRRPFFDSRGAFPIRSRVRRSTTCRASLL